MCGYKFKYLIWRERVACVHGFAVVKSFIPYNPKKYLTIGRWYIIPTQTTKRYLYTLLHSFRYCSFLCSKCHGDRIGINRRNWLAGWLKIFCCKRMGGLDVDDEDNDDGESERQLAPRVTAAGTSSSTNKKCRSYYRHRRWIIPVLLLLLLLLVEQTRAMGNCVSSPSPRRDDVIVAPTTVRRPWAQRSLRYQRARAHYYQCANEFQVF